MNDAVAAASADYPVDQTGRSYDFVGDYFPDIAPGPGHRIRGSTGPASAPSGFGLAAPGHLTKACYPGLIAHEMGHAYGGRHASLWQTSDGNPVSATGKLVEYSDTYDPMGGSNRIYPALRRL